MAALLEKPVMKPRKLSLFDQLREEMDRMFDMPAPRFGLAPWREVAFVPPIEIEEKDNTLFVKADLPGMKKEHVKVEVAPEGVTIVGERKEEKEEKKEKVLQDRAALWQLRALRSSARWRRIRQGVCRVQGRRADGDRSSGQRAKAGGEDRVDYVT